jgi:hypothetical protein
MRDNIPEIHYHNLITAKKFIPYVLIFFLLVLIIPLYVKVYKPTSTKTTLLLENEDQQLALSVSATFVDLINYYSQNSSNYNGSFEVTLNSPSHANFKVINSNGQDITKNVILSLNITSPSIINFNNASGTITLQYTNSLATNYLTRIDVVV